MKSKGTLKVIIFYVVLIGVLLVAIASVMSVKKNDNLNYGDIIAMFEKEEVKKCTVGNDNVLLIQTHDG